MWIFLFFNQSWIIMEFHFSNQSVCYGFWFFKLKLKCCGINPVAVGTSGDFSTTPNWSGKGSKKIPTSCCVAASASSYAAPTSCTVNVASGTYQTQVWCFAFLFSVCIDRVGRAHAVIKETYDGSHLVLNFTDCGMNTFRTPFIFANRGIFVNYFCITRSPSWLFGKSVIPCSNNQNHWNPLQCFVALNFRAAMMPWSANLTHLNIVTSFWVLALQL